MALIDTVSLTLVDVLSYEGSITSAQIDGFPQPVSLVAKIRIRMANCSVGRISWRRSR